MSVLFPAMEKIFKQGEKRREGRRILRTGNCLRILLGPEAGIFGDVREEIRG